MNITGKKLCVLGDSITQGAGLERGEDLFWKVLEQEQGLRQAVGYGIGGTRIARQKTEREDLSADSCFSCRYRLMEDDADIVLVFGGTNDYGHGDAPLGGMADRCEDTFYGACHCLLSGLLNKYPDAVILVATPLHRADEAALNPFTHLGLEDYVRALKQTAAYYSLPLLDFYSMSGIQPAHPACRERLCPDGIHPNARGHLLLAQRLAGFLRAL